MCSNRIKSSITVYKLKITEENSKQLAWGQVIEMLSTGKKKSFEYGSRCTLSKLLCQRCNMKAQENLLKLNILALLTEAHQIMTFERNSMDLKRFSQTLISFCHALQEPQRSCCNFSSISTAYIFRWLLCRLFMAFCTFTSSIVLLYFWGLALTRRNTLNSPSSPKRGKKNQTKHPPQTGDG